MKAGYTPILASMHVLEAGTWLPVGGKLKSHKRINFLGTRRMKKKKKNPLTLKTPSSAHYEKKINDVLSFTFIGYYDVIIHSQGWK